MTNEEMKMINELPNIKTQKQPNGEWTAINEDAYDYDSYVGWGKTEAEAVQDLVEATDAKPVR